MLMYHICFVCIYPLIYTYIYIRREREIKRERERERMYILFDSYAICGFKQTLDVASVTVAAV